MKNEHIRLDQCDVVVTGSYSPIDGGPAAQDYPLIVAVHGGTYTGKYFDVEGASLQARATSLGIPFVAINRPCYGDSGDLPPADASILRSAEVVNQAIGQIWSQHRAGARGVVVIGHSIGGAAAILIASMVREWPLLGIAISGIGLEPPASVKTEWKSLPLEPKIAMDAALKDSLMFGPKETFLPSTRSNAHLADDTTPRQELQDIAFNWPGIFEEHAARVEVPVHYRQPEFDHLWKVDAHQVELFSSHLSKAPSIDAKVFHGAGHCIDFHRLGAAFQLEQLAFAMRCCVP